MLYSKNSLIVPEIVAPQLLVVVPNCILTYPEAPVPVPVPGVKVIFPPLLFPPDPAFCAVIIELIPSVVAEAVPAFTFKIPLK